MSRSERNRVLDGSPDRDARRRYTDIDGIGNPYQIRPTHRVSLCRLESEYAPRPAAWRWHLAALGISRPNDAALQEAVRYIRAVNACRTEADYDRAVHLYPYLHAAYMMHIGSDKLARGILEARILADQTVEEIATLCRLPVGVVTIYERLYLDVRHMRTHWIYILQEVLGDKFLGGLNEQDVDLIVKKLGFLRGAPMVDQLVRYYSATWDVPDSLAGMSRPQMEELATMLDIKTAIWAMTLPVEEAPKVLRLQSLVGDLWKELARMPSVPEAPADVAPSSPPVTSPEVERSMTGIEPNSAAESAA